MSTWINKATAAQLGLCTLLSACVPMATGPSGTRSASILNGGMTVAAPGGYCIDRAASQAMADAAVILIGRCSDAAGVPPAAIAATVGAAGSAAVLAAGPAEMAGYFRSAEGRAALSRQGQAESVSVLDVGSAGGAIVLHLTDTAVGEYWRAVLGLRGRLVTLAVTAPEGQPLSAAEGRSLLLRAISSMRAANPDNA